MKAIIVDDEPLMVRHFVRLSAGIRDLNIVGEFETPAAAIEFASRTPPDVAFLDVAMPEVSGLDLAKALRRIRSDIIIVFVTAYDEYLWDFNQIGGDYYIMKPYSKATLTMAMDRIRLLATRQTKPLYVQTFGRFTVFRDGLPIPLTGKAKEILALLVVKRGKELSNESIYNTIWEGRPYSNTHMSVYFNALRRLKSCLQAHRADQMLLSTHRGQMVDPTVFDCDYYAWQDNNLGKRDRFEGEFLSEYTWAESFLANILKIDYNSV